MYGIKLSNMDPLPVIARLSQTIEKDGRFTAELETTRNNTIRVSRVRLTKAKPYCGQHPGECVANGREKKVMKYLEWEDWVAFHALVNDVLDRLKAEAEVWSNPQERLDKGDKMWIRRGLQRRYRYEWETSPRSLGVPLRIWNHGTPDQFEPEG